MNAITNTYQAMRALHKVSCLTCNKVYELAHIRNDILAQDIDGWRPGLESCSPSPGPESNLCVSLTHGFRVPRSLSWIQNMNPRFLAKELWMCKSLKRSSKITSLYHQILLHSLTICNIRRPATKIGRAPDMGTLERLNFARQVSLSLRPKMLISWTPCTAFSIS